MARLIGIKSSFSPTQLANKLSVNPKLVEIHVQEDDMNTIRDKVAFVRATYPDIKIVFHAPTLNATNQYCDICSNEGLGYIIILLKLCEEYDYCLGVVVHPEPPNNQADLQERFALQWGRIPTQYKQYAFVENLDGRLTRQASDFKKLLEKNDITHVTFDMSHFGATHTQKEIEEMLEYLTKKYSVYVHISDHTLSNQHFGAEHIGEGTIDFTALKKNITFGILETNSVDENIGVEIRNDYRAIQTIFSEK